MLVSCVFGCEDGKLRALAADAGISHFPVRITRDLTLQVVTVWIWHFQSLVYIGLLDYTVYRI